MRLERVEFGHTGEAAATVAAMREQGYASDIGVALQYRPELFGRPFSVLTQELMKGPSEWSPGERELLAAFVSARSRCPY